MSELFSKIKSFVQGEPVAAIVTIRKRIGDILIAHLGTSSEQEYHSIGFDVNYPAIVDWQGAVAGNMPVVTTNRIVGQNTVYVAAEMPTGADPVSGEV